MHKITERITWLAVTAVISGWTIFLYVDGRSTKGFMGILTIAALLAVGFWQMKAQKPFPPLFAVMTYIFIFISVGLGTFAGGYRIHHFDDFLHVSSGIWIGYGAWIVLCLLVGEELKDKLPSAFVALYLVAVALAVAGTWELLEFAGDKLLHFTAQGRDPDDTMFDMIDGLIGGTIFTIFFVIKRRASTKIGE